MGPPDRRSPSVRGRNVHSVGGGLESDTGVLLLVLELAPGEHQWHGVVLLTADDEQRVAHSQSEMALARDRLRAMFCTARSSITSWSRTSRARGAVQGNRRGTRGLVPPGQGPVPHDADTAERAVEHAGLLRCGVGPALVRRPHSNQASPITPFRISVTRERGEERGALQASRRIHRPAGSLASRNARRRAASTLLRPVPCGQLIRSA